MDKRLTLSQALASYLIPWRRAHWPLDWAEIFGSGCRASAVEVEIGFGDGAYLAEQAAQYPERAFVGVEVSWTSTQKLLARLIRQRLENVRVLLGDARFLLQAVLPPESVRRFTIHFPDPWPKARHHGRRLIQPQTVRLLAERLVVGGELLLATDHPEYAQWITEVLQGQTALRSRFPQASVPRLPGRRPTKYERRALDAGRPIHYFLWYKHGPIPLRGSPHEGARYGEEVEAKAKAKPMPNVVLRGPFDEVAFLEGFQPQTWREEHDGVPVVIKLQEAFRRRAGGCLLLEALVREGDFTQHFALLLIRKGDEVLIKPAALGRPRPTWGVKRAVSYVAAWLRRAFPLEVASSTVGAIENPNLPS